MEKVKDYLTKDNLILCLASYATYKLAVRPTLSLLGTVYQYILRPRRNLKKRYGDNSWAMVTGSTSGIGAGFAEQLAREGFHLILVSRSTSKLEAQKGQLGEKFKDIQIETRTLDLSSTRVEDFIELGESVAHLDVSILVNNAGGATLSPLDETEFQELETMINLNIGPYVYLTRNLLPRMLKREKRSGIIFNASIGADISVPCNSTYCGSKAFADHFAKSLAYENPEKIDVLSYKPNTVQSNLVKMKPSFAVLTATEAANSALDKLGWDVQTEGHWRHVIVNSGMRASTSLLTKKSQMRLKNKIWRKLSTIWRAAQKNES